MQIRGEKMEQSDITKIAEQVTAHRMAESALCQTINYKYKQAYVGKADKMKHWQRYKKAYDGDFFREAGRPEYKSNQVSNYIFSTVESIRPIMVDNDPRFIATPTREDGVKFASDVQTALDYEWDRANMSIQLTSQLIPMLIYGTAIWYIGWDGKKGKIGEVDCRPVNPFNFFPDPLADSIDTAEYVIYASYKHANQLKKDYPDKADKFIGGNISQSELVNDRDSDATGPQEQILVLECWYRDWSTVDQEVKLIEGKTVTNKIPKYPNGRVTCVCPDIGVVLFDRQNPYKDGKFPFVIMKDHDIPFEFWGRGEVEQILSPQIYLNELTNQIVDNAKMTANTAWVVDNNCGIAKGQLKNAPGIIIRKKQGTEVRRDAPTPMPSYVGDQIAIFKKDIQDISGVFDSLKGDKQTGVVSAQAIMALQEASQARIRLKIKLLERFLGDLANIWYNRIQQFWVSDKWLMVTDIDGNLIKKHITKDIKAHDYDIRIGSGSTMPTNKNAMLDLMIRLAQTMGEDGMPIVDRQAVLQYLPAIDKKEIVDRFDERKDEAEKKQKLQEDVQSKIAEAQQVGQQEKKTITDSLKQLRDMFQVVDGQIDELMRDKAKREDDEEFSKYEEQGYKRGVVEGQQSQGQNQEQDPGQSEEDDMSEEDLQALYAQQFDPSSRLMDEDELMPDDEDVPGTLSVEELEELSNMDPEELIQLLQNDPELAQLLMGDMGELQEAQGMIQEGQLPNMPGFDADPEALEMEDQYVD